LVNHDIGYRPFLDEWLAPVDGEPVDGVALALPEEPEGDEGDAHEQDEDHADAKQRHAEHE
jgi:hypothetical protein